MFAERCLRSRFMRAGTPGVCVRIRKRLVRQTSVRYDWHLAQGQSLKQIESVVLVSWFGYWNSSFEFLVLGFEHGFTPSLRPLWLARPAPLKLETRNLKPETRNPKPETRNWKPETPNPKPQTPNPKPDARSSKPKTRNPTPETPDPNPEIRSLKPETRTPKN